MTTEPIPATNVRLWENFCHCALAEPLAIEPRKDGEVVVTVDHDSGFARRLLDDGRPRRRQPFMVSVDRNGERYLGDPRQWAVHRQDDGAVVLKVTLRPFARSVARSVYPAAQYVETLSED